MASNFIFHSLKRIAYLLPLSLLSPLLVCSEQKHSTPKQAERLFYEKLYGDAIPLYAELFADSEDTDLKVQWALRLAACHLEEDQPEIALNVLSSPIHPLHRNQTLYLMSLAHRQQKQFPQALHLLEQCFFPDSEVEKNLIALEKGFHLLKMGDLIHAEQMFKSISQQEKDPITYQLAQLQIIKILLINHHYHDALRILKLSTPILSQLPPLNIERNYLKGWAHLALQQESEAVLCFEELLPKAFSSNERWSIQIQNNLITAYLRLAIKIADADQLNPLFLKIEDLINKLIKQHPTETSYLLLTDFYLIKAKCLNDPNAYTQAQQLLDKSNLISSPAGLCEALLKRAAAAPSYAKRSQSYQELSMTPTFTPHFQAKIWFLKGLNDLEEGLRKLRTPLEESCENLKEAGYAFNRTIELEPETDQAALAYKYLILSYIHLSHPLPLKQAKATLDQLTSNKELFSKLKCAEEIYCLSAWIALRLNDHEALKKEQAFLSKQRSKNPFWNERFLKLKGLIFLQLEEWQQADLIFKHLIKNEFYSSSRGEAWFWRAFCADQEQKNNLKKECLQQAYAEDRESPYAPMAYFYFYTYREYMQGHRKAIKHLQAMADLFPNHILLVNAYYLLGLHHKKNHFSEDGFITKRKDLISAIDAFQLAESTFDTLLKKNAIPCPVINYYIQIRIQAQLERAQANLAIAQSGKGSKRQIYLEYAEEVFKQIIEDFTNPQGLAKKGLIQPDSPYPKVWAEAEWGLGKTFEEKNEWKRAEKIWNLSLTHYQDAHISQGYGLMRVWYSKGKLAMRQSQFAEALLSFTQAEKAVHGQVVLSPNEKLDLWIQQSMCYKEQCKFEEAMTILSQVINDDVISPLRIKAMFLRAEIYELQGRPELAIKQLEAAAKKGGDWAQQAKEKLEKTYGY